MDLDGQFRVGLTVGDNVATLRTPEALLEAQDVRGGSDAGTAFGSQLGGESGSLDKSWQHVSIPRQLERTHQGALTAVGAANGEEGAAGNLLPQIKTGLVPGHYY